MKFPKTKQAQQRFIYNRDLLPNIESYYASQGLKLIGRGKWKSALCPFHEDTNPSLRINIDSGGFRCMACGAHGGDILAFHMQRYDLSFKDVARAFMEGME